MIVESITTVLSGRLLDGLIVKTDVGDRVTVDTDGIELWVTVLVKKSIVDCWRSWMLSNAIPYGFEENSTLQEIRYYPSTLCEEQKSDLALMPCKICYMY